MHQPNLYMNWNRGILQITDLKWQENLNPPSNPIYCDGDPYFILSYSIESCITLLNVQVSLRGPLEYNNGMLEKLGMET